MGLGGLGGCRVAVQAPALGWPIGVRLLAQSDEQSWRELGQAWPCPGTTPLSCTQHPSPCHSPVTPHRLPVQLPVPLAGRRPPVLAWRVPWIETAAVVRRLRCGQPWSWDEPVQKGPVPHLRGSKSRNCSQDIGNPRRPKTARHGQALPQESARPAARRVGLPWPRDSSVVGHLGPADKGACGDRELGSVVSFSVMDLTGIGDCADCPGPCHGWLAMVCIGPCWPLLGVVVCARNRPSGVMPSQGKLQVPDGG